MDARDGLLLPGFFLGLDPTPGVSLAAGSALRYSTSNLAPVGLSALFSCSGFPSVGNYVVWRSISAS